MLSNFKYILFLLLLASCVKESRIAIPYYGDRIVVNSLIQPDSLIYIRVTMSKQATDASSLTFVELDSAQVTLQEDGITLPAPQLKRINGLLYFVSNTVAKTGSYYSLQVVNDGLTTVSGEDSTPVKPTISNGYAQRAAKKVKFTLADDGGTTSYYRIRVFNADSVYNIIKTDTVFFRLDPALNNDLPDIIGNNYKSEYLIDDKYLNGKSFQFVLQTENEVISKYMVIEVSTLTPTAWKYMRTSESERLEDEQNFTFDPANIYSNVENGYGIIAGLNAARLSFTVE